MPIAITEGDAQMKCPICGNGMEQGFLQTAGQRVAWMKRIHKVFLRPKTGEIMLENNTFKAVSFTAHICKLCKKIVVDYSDKEVQEG